MSSASSSSSPSSSQATTPEPQPKRSKSKSQPQPVKQSSKAKASVLAASASPARKRKAPEPEPESTDDSDAADSKSGDDDNSGSEDEEEDDDEHEKKRDSDADSDSDEDEDKQSGDDEKMDEDSDQPVLSHAERRRRKKEAKKLATDGPASKKQKLANGASKDTSSKKKPDTAQTPASGRKNSVWVGNMSFKTTPENLKAFFKDVGGEVTRVHMPMKAPTKPGLKPENRGFAYVDFETPEAQKAAVALSENPLLGRKLLIKIGDDFAGRPAPADLALKDPALIQKTHSKTAQKILRAQKQPPAPTLFFGNLGFETTEESIRELLEAHRPVQKAAKKSAGKKAKKGTKAEDESDDEDDDEDDEDGVKVKKAGEEGKDKSAGTENWIRKIRMGTFEDTGKCKGFAFVDFVSIEHATACLINPQNHRLNGRQLVVEYAGAEAVRRGAPKGQKTPVNNGAAVASTSTSRRGGAGKGPQVGGGSGDRHGRNDGEGGPPFHRAGRRAGEVGKEHGDGVGGGGPAAKQGKVIPDGVDRLGGGSVRADGENDLGEDVPSGGSSRRQWEGQTGESRGYKKNGFGKGERNGPGQGGYNGKSRPKPGAALALAKRESAAIIPSQGSKITF